MFLKPMTIQTSPAQLALRRIFLILTLCAAGMATLLALLPAPGHDQLWFLLMAHRWLAGAQIYGPQAFDSNPPGIVWLSAIPILLAQTLHLSTTVTAKLLVILAESAASVLSFHFLRLSRPKRELTLRTSYELPALLFAAFILFYLAPARDFGQRDHILSFLILPYLLAAAVPPALHRQTAARSLAGIAAAIGICLKPHHALIVLAVELSLLLIPSLSNRAPWATRFRRLLRPEPILITLLGLAYLAAIHHLTPLYFTLALPTLRDTYWAIGGLSLPALLIQAIELALLAAAAVILFAQFRHQSPAITLLLIAGLAAFAAYLIQGTGWYYQQLPAIACFGAALTLQLLDLLATRLYPANQAAHPLTIPKWLTPATAALSILALALTTHFTGYPFTPNRIYAPVFADASMPDPAFFSNLPPNTPIAILTTSVESSMMPVDRFHLTWSQRTNNLWLLPAILRSESPNSPRRIPPARLADLDAMQHRWMVEDLTHWHPQLILIERCQVPTITCQELQNRDGQPRHDNLLTWFQRDPAFTALWTHYTYTETRGHFDAYVLNR
jgi:hypothetical protein